MPALRFEERFEILHCGVTPVLIGNLSLRGPAENTKIAYRCARCWQEFTLVDTHVFGTPADLAAVNALHDTEE